MGWSVVSVMGELGLNVNVTDAAFPGTKADTFLACEAHVVDALFAQGRRSE